MSGKLLWIFSADYNSLFLKRAIDGDNGGDSAKTKFPAKFEVDYVRIYLKNR